MSWEAKGTPVQTVRFIVQNPTPYRPRFSKIQRNIRFWTLSKGTAGLEAERRERVERPGEKEPKEENPKGSSIKRARAH